MRAWVGGGERKRKRCLDFVHFFFQSAKKKLVSPRYSYLTFLNYRLFMVILQKWCGGLFLYKHLKLAIEKKAKKVDAVSFLMSFYS